MKLRNSSRALVAGMAIAAAITMTACSSDDDKKSESTTSTTTSASANSGTVDPNLPPIPTPADLNSQLAKALDPATPTEEIVDMVQGADKDPNLIKQLADNARNSGISVEITDVVPPTQPYPAEGPVLTANGNITVSGQPPGTAIVYFVPEDGKWKLQQAWACNVLVNVLALTSPACG